MAITEQGAAVMLWGIGSAISHVSLHDGEPTADNELRGGVYRRKPIEFRDPLNSELRSLREIEIEVPQGARVTHAGFWTALIGGVLLASGKTKDEHFRGRGVYRIDLAKFEIEE